MAAVNRESTVSPPTVPPPTEAQNMTQGRAGLLRGTREEPAVTTTPSGNFNTGFN